MPTSSASQQNTQPDTQPVAQSASRRRRRSLQLARFLPYRVSILANTVSQTLARLYEKRFGITIPEWRVIAVLGSGETLSAGEIAQRTAMDKVQVSRAISRMLTSELILRESGDTDRRKALLTLTAKAMEIYNEIVPMALDYQNELTRTLSAEETEQFDQLLTKLQGRAEQLARSTEAGAL